MRAELALERAFNVLGERPPIVRVYRVADRRPPADALRFLSLAFRSRSRLAAENLFLRKQLALYA